MFEFYSMCIIAIIGATTVGVVWIVMRALLIADATDGIAMRRALLMAHHELTTLSGLQAFDAEDPKDVFTIDASQTLAVIRKAIGPITSADTCTPPYWGHNRKDRA